jgi:hypothetical protein
MPLCKRSTYGTGFRYLADPVCIAALGIYALARIVLRPLDLETAWMHNYLNDLLCLPLFLPMILRLQTLLHLRSHHRAPRWWEIVQHWLIFSIVFEVILPRYPQMYRTTADPLDSVAYLAGGTLAALFWWRLPQRLARVITTWLADAPQPAPLTMTPDESSS